MRTSLTFCSAINSFNSSPQLGNVCLLIHGLNKISIFSFVYADAVLDVLFSLGNSGEVVISFGHCISAGTGSFVVVRLSVHVHFNLGLSLQYMDLS